MSKKPRILLQSGCGYHVQRRKKGMIYNRHLVDKSFEGNTDGLVEFKIPSLT